MSNDPRLVSSQALAKAQALEARLNALVPQVTPQTATVLYTPTTTVVTQASNGNYTWTCPAGVTSAKVECWGAGAGGGGGSSGEGGEGGGGGEYAAEPSYPVVPGQVYNYTVGGGGTGGTTNSTGNDGGYSNFDQSVFASGGSAGAGGFIGGAGGSGSQNTVEWPGGNGGGNNTQGTGGCGGGGSGGSLGAGANGATSASSAGAGGGGGGSGTSGNGGGGGSSGANGIGGATPGGGGGGAGAASGATQGTNSYRFTGSFSYFGSDATGGNANGYMSSGTINQGGETASGGSYNGTMKGVGVLPSSVSSDLAGVTIDSITLRLEWLHTWYNSGAYVNLGYISSTNLGGAWNGTHTAVKTYWQGSVGSPVNQSLTSTGLGAALQSGAAKTLTFGPGTPGFNLYNYGNIYGAGGDNSRNPLLTVNWHTGAAPVQAGAGFDGQVRITYTTTSALTAAVQPLAGTDDAGNAFSAGYTGTTQNFQPGSSPTVSETWHTATYQNSWAAAATGSDLMYTLTSDGFVHLSGRLVAGATVSTGGPTTVITLPAGYVPARNEPISILCHNAASPFGVNTSVLGLVDSGGLVKIYGNYNSGQNLEIQCRFPLNA